MQAQKLEWDRFGQTWPRREMGFEKMEEEEISTKETEGIMTSLCDLFYVIYFHCLIKEKEGCKVKVMVLREEESAGVG